MAESIISKSRLLSHKGQSWQPLQTRTAKDGTPRYTAEVRLKGYPAQTATFKRKTDAKKWIQDTETAIREGRHFKTAEAKKHTFADLVDRYIKDVLPSKPKQEQAERKSKWNGGKIK